MITLGYFKWHNKDPDQAHDVHIGVMSYHYLRELCVQFNTSEWGDLEEPTDREDVRITFQAATLSCVFLDTGINKWTGTGCDVSRILDSNGY
jgi:hypothetical protein